MYKDLYNILKDRKCGEFQLSHFEIKPDDLYAAFHNIPYGKFVKLLHNGELIMSDTEMERRTNMDFVRAAQGNVLIGGLGIGMVLLAIQDKPEIKSITILEKYTEVIELVGNQIPFNDKVKIVEADVFNYKTKKLFDTIYLDIWNYINKKVYREQMLPLIRKYREILVPIEMNPSRWLDCWCSYEARNGIKI